MSKNSAVKVSPSAEEPSPTQLNLAEESEVDEESEEEVNEDEEEEEDISDVNSIDDQNMQQQISPSLPMRKSSKRYQLPAEQLNWFENQSEKEKRRPRLENGNQSNWKQFRAEHKVYREEQNGNQPMVNLISIKARNGLLIHLNMDTKSFLKLTDEQVTTLLDKHFKLNQISNYKEILSRCHMVKSTNEEISIDRIQLYTEDFIDKLSQNPHFQRDKLRGAPPKIINEIFTDGLQPPVFRAVVRDLGTTKITSTIKMLPDVYSESEIYIKWKKRSDETDSETVSVSKRENKVPMSGKYCNNCINIRPNIARGHTEANCYYLHPEKRKEKEESDKAQRDRDIPKVAHFADVQAMRVEMKEMELQLAFMTNLLSNQKDEDA